MNKITLENFRCFRKKQEARLAPLTLLVGENSTGKTSFLALVRALWDLTFWDAIPDFKEVPYDLGTFDEMAQYRGGRGGRAGSIAVGCDTTTTRGDLVRHETTFHMEGSAPVPVKVTVEYKDIRAEHRFTDGCIHLRFHSSQDDEWVWKDTDIFYRVGAGAQQHIPSLNHSIWRMLENASQDTPWGTLSNEKNAGNKISDKQKERLREFVVVLQASSMLLRPFASAPVRSKPRRTYDPARPTLDPEGMGVPMYLAEMHFHGGEQWDWLRESLNKFGQDAGLFDEITVKRFAPSLSSPFQLQVKKHGDKAKGPWRNLIDVGYGISQVLPIITELFRPDGHRTFLVQQPEVHLHPSGQAALGSLFCDVAASGRQLVVETHSDHLLERVRLDIRDGKTTNWTGFPTSKSGESERFPPGAFKFSTGMMSIKKPVRLRRIANRTTRMSSPSP